MFRASLFCFRARGVRASRTRSGVRYDSSERCLVISSFALAAGQARSAANEVLENRVVSRVASQSEVEAWGFEHINSIWRESLQNEHLRTIGQWSCMHDDEITINLVGVAALDRWWAAVGNACPLIVSPVAERTICEVRKHLTRLLVERPETLHAGHSTSLLVVARALAAQAQQSEFAFMVSKDEMKMALRLREKIDRNVLEGTLREIADSMLHAFPPQRPAVFSEHKGAVHAFYERYPIPLWVHLTPWSPKEQLPTALRAAGRPGSKALVAGCGTGRWACHFASCFPQTSVLAVDISNTSVEYARSRKREHGLENLEFRQVDLREPWTLESCDFDFIECGGVLHHLEDPQAAWAQLVALLRPDGVMNVSLYSRAARRQLKELRRSILGREISGTDHLSDEALRCFRHDLIARTWATDYFNLARSPDLHSLSRLRDAFFHPLEHEYDLLEVKQMLTSLGLEFATFADAESLNVFRSCCPRGDISDLRHWHALEQHSPELFISMYDFFVRRR
eukprot:TRINITY_DN69148_c0_g1_i1.p1 TRINITY_DN69148_c0_g1~~TRINITY_DN69148_c0_g1_i1.p1  ORF type:complete len:511 (+),score=55.93 TRINITY_DN69148_c0_g1_i1:95-1627(+)